LREVFEEHIRICRKCRINLHSMEKTIFISKFLYKEEKIPKKVKKKLYYRVRMRYKK
jgi:hypothetical protein